jgi:hypothetical protein
MTKCLTIEELKEAKNKQFPLRLTQEFSSIVDNISYIPGKLQITEIITITKFERVKLLHEIHFKSTDRDESSLVIVTDDGCSVGACKGTGLVSGTPVFEIDS